MPSFFQHLTERDVLIAKRDWFSVSTAGWSSSPFTAPNDMTNDNTILRGAALGFCRNTTKTTNEPPSPNQVALSCKTAVTRSVMWQRTVATLLNKTDTGRDTGYSQMFWGFYWIQNTLANYHWLWEEIKMSVHSTVTSLSRLLHTTTPWLHTMEMLLLVI